MVAKATGQRVSGTVVVTESTALASIGGPLENGEIRINPRAAATIPPNSWAFIIGHEFAHRTHGLSSPEGTNPEMEAEADAIGARYAMAAGFDLAAHLDWTLTHLRDGWSNSHGSIHDRAFRLAARYGFSSPPIW
jgi:Zn-dependent protease with chaperone function